PSPLTPFVADVCASFQESVVDTLIQKTMQAAKAFGIDRVVVGGGVAANSRLREKFPSEARKNGLKVFFVQPIYCTDNAAMIAQVAFQRFRKGRPPRKSAIDPSLQFENWGR
ncbi:MAG: tRNA (adenosine(37)-N6)-threonylcarbamoyltransferase complex transferase subunit TsaD, partial [Elusimicrobia bacterium]|nr:tRNA (adenosine(37)-N6)-threonylcarbamoyltransferase complex transferase subunit TsaD [Elusimicrobiota bacterium]